MIQIVLGRLCLLDSESSLCILNLHCLPANSQLRPDNILMLASAPSLMTLPFFPPQQSVKNKFELLKLEKVKDKSIDCGSG